MLKHRLITGPLMILALALIFYLDHILDHFSIDGTFLQHVFVGRTYPPAGLLTLAVLLVLIILSSRELYAIFHAKGIPANGALISLAAVLGCFLVYVIPYYADSPTSVAIFATAVVVVFLAALIRHSWLNHRTEGSVAVAAVTLFSFMYLGLLPGFYLAIRRWHDAEVVAAIILITKACDVGAYFTGRFLGRHKLI
ncbi:MAG: phosphatidate cytidylyltransferase, partial [Phycisphaeraceae bacterium]|nr:phosphatidate cytidylyltransferase [Phycisphaeraceae bacterium]